jgi:hypothetical protein
MKKVFNPTNQDVSITVEGDSYQVLAGEFSQPLRDAVAERWAETHQFLTIATIEEALDAKVAKANKELKTKVEKTEEVKEVEEPKVAQPKVAHPKSTKSVATKVSLKDVKTK